MAGGHAGIFGQLSGVLQQGGNGIRSRISHQAAHAVCADLDAGSIALDKDGVTNRYVRQPDPRPALDRKDPGFPIGI